MNIADALVVGAGPAGAMAALSLARAGVRVRVVDRATFPRDKLCGDTINPGTLAILDRAGLGNAVRARAIGVRGMMVTGPGVQVRAAYPLGYLGAALSRRHFDSILLDAAARAGACIDVGINVGSAFVGPGERIVGGVLVRSSGRTYAVRARVVIAADGRGSRLAASLGLSRFAAWPQRWAFGAYYAGVSGLTDYGEMHLTADGYMGIAPLPDGLANVCVVRQIDRRTAAPVRLDQRKVLGDAIARDPTLRERFARATQVTPVAVLGPLAVDACAAGLPGLLLAGDAAGFVDPVTGDGLRFALRGAELAADAAVRELDSGAPAHPGLWRERQREFGGKWRLNRGLRRLIGSPRALRGAAAISRCWPAPVEYLVGIAGDVHLAGGPSSRLIGAA